MKLMGRPQRCEEVVGLFTMLARRRIVNEFVVAFGLGDASQGHLSGLRKTCGLKAAAETDVTSHPHIGAEALFTRRLSIFTTRVADMKMLVGATLHVDMEVVMVIAEGILRRDLNCEEWSVALDRSDDSEIRRFGWSCDPNPATVFCS